MRGPPTLAFPHKCSFFPPENGFELELLPHVWERRCDLSGVALTVEAVNYPPVAVVEEEEGGAVVSFSGMGFEVVGAALGGTGRRSPSPPRRTGRFKKKTPELSIKPAVL